MSGQTGFMVNVNRLFGGDHGAEAFCAVKGKTIASVTVSDNCLNFTFVGDGPGLEIKDEGQSCCEHRFMVCDDDLSAYAGAELTGAEIKDAPNVQGEHEDEEHEVQFLEIQTSKGVFTVASHNEHNGYYGGFWIRASLTEPPK